MTSSESVIGDKISLMHLSIRILRPEDCDNQMMQKEQGYCNEAGEAKEQDGATLSANVHKA